MTALIRAIGSGHMGGVVNRLLDCKEINVNVQSKVSRIVDFATFHSPNSLPMFFGCVFF